MASAPTETNLTRRPGRPNTVAVAQRIVASHHEIEGAAFGATLLQSEALDHDAQADAHVAMIEGLAGSWLTRDDLTAADRRLCRAILRECAGYWRADSAEDGAVIEARQQTRLIAGLCERAETGRMRPDLQGMQP